MRRPQTKQPYAFRRKATRTQGRPVHRLYRMTPRPPMHGRVIYFAGLPDGDIIFWTFQNPPADFGVVWWGNQSIESANYLAAMQSTTTPGRTFNSIMWDVNLTTWTDWSVIYTTIFDTLGKITTTDPFPQTPDFDFTF